MGQSGSPLLSFACPQRLPYRTNISDEATTALSRFRKATPTRGAADYGRRCVCQAAKLLSNAAGSDGSRLQGTKNAPQSALGLENSGCACAEGCSRAWEEGVAGAGTGPETWDRGVARRPGRLQTPRLGRWGAPELGRAWCSYSRPTRTSRRVTPSEVPVPTLGRTWQGCGRAGPRLCVCVPQSSAQVETKGQSPLVTIETRVKNRKSIFNCFG